MITSFTSTLLPLPSIRLGRLITNRNYPHECYHDPPGVPEPVICPQKTHRAFASSSSSTLTLRTRLAKMLGARYHRTQTDSIDIFATQAHTYYMDNSETWFSRACADSAVRAFLQEAIEHGDSVYLVVGYLTVVDAAVTVNGGGGGEIRGSTDGETVGVEAGYEGDTVQRSGWDAEGEQVYAVQYRKVRFSMFSSKKGVLGENRWRMYVKRGRKDVDDSVEASLEEKGGMPEGQGE